MKFDFTFSKKTGHSYGRFMASLLNVVVFQMNPFWIHLCYFIIVSIVGFSALKFTKPKSISFSPKNFDLFFTSVSASTVSSMSVIDMEVFSNAQLIILTSLMFLGGEVFTSMLSLQSQKHRIINSEGTMESKAHSVNSSDQMELGLVSQLHSSTNIIKIQTGQMEISTNNKHYNFESLKCLGYVVLVYLLVIHISGTVLVYSYMKVISSARQILEKKGLQTFIFALFTTVSTFSNCGFVPTNENMTVFKKNSGLLLLLVPQVLLGNTLYPSCLRFMIWVLHKITKREEYGYLLENSVKMGYDYLLSTLHSCLLAVTVFGFIVVQFVLFCYVEWSSEAMDGLNSYEKFVGSLFQTTNSRHTGETIVDLSIISPAILVVFLVMMYLPPQTCFIPAIGCDEDKKHVRKCKKKAKKIVDYFLFSQLSYLVISIILICVAEGQKMREDPLNFNVLNITVEVISAYGNVGFSTGYSCGRQLKPADSCKDRWFGFSGKWSNKGKLILILVMFLGRLKKFNMKGGRYWKLS